ncbi:KpsF/GutQ family sugar-phosphate isomerase [Candidatus Chlorobium masyuteum]|uniref:KpsF/GutQ family sugar-phosphate isomerase n=1 Tax=Candidatus Chlorobium masyuteum TaxID=2716876 RepID=UPI001AA092C2|nr:KpsF/GutQ family sugar-phosphate isomerase [Candidatus Chlorobium masyuteum]
MSETLANLHITETGKSILIQEARAIQMIAERLDSRFSGAVELLASCSGKIIISGMGKSGIIGQKIAATMASTGSTALFLHPADAAHGDLGIVSRGDAVICLSKSGTTDELNFIVPALKEIGVSIIAMTGNPRSFLAQNADIMLDTGIEKEACPYDLAPTTSTTAMLAMGDALAIALMQRKNFTQRDFALTHPKGSLGRRLTVKVSSVMAKESAVPVVHEEASVTELILEMTSKRYGVSAVVNEEGRLTGIFTDGDLRRLVQNGTEFLSRTAGSVMTPNPKTVTTTTLAKECLDILETYRITQLMVCDSEHRPVGLVHIHDLITLGL